MVPGKTTFCGLLLVAAAFPAQAKTPSSPASRIEKMARLLAFEDRRSLGDGELDRYLADPDPGLRRRAALAAGRVGDPASLPTLIQRMNDAEPEVRQMAAFAMGLIGDKQAVERLLASLLDPEAVVKARAAEALGRIGDPRAAPAIAKMVLDATPKTPTAIVVRGDDPSNPYDPWLVQRLGLFALARLKDLPAAESTLLNAGKPRFDWWAATWTAMRLESPALRPVLAAATTASDPVSRALAARGLGALKDTSQLDLVLPLLRDQEESVVVMAVRAVGALGHARGAPAVAALLRSQNPTLQIEALKALAALPRDKGLRPQVVALVGHEQPAIRAAALQALAHLDREEFALVLSTLDPDPVFSVRAALGAALAESGDEVSLGVLYSLLKDEDPRVLPPVLESIRKARGKDAADTLVRYLEHADFAVRAAAAEGLAALKATGQTTALASAYRMSRSDADLDARLGQVAALSVQNDAKAHEVLREIAGSDPVRVVRVRAASALSGLGQQPPWSGFEAVDRPHLDYRQAMAPFDPQPGVPLFTPRVLLHTRRGVIEVHLNVVEAPLNVASFLDLARRGFYDGLTFHRVVPNFVIQGGDPRGDGNGGPGYTLRCEVGEKPYGRGIVGMALSGKDTGGSQFFITLSPQPHLDGNYTVIGWVAQGMEVADQVQPGDAIERVEVWDGR